MHKIIGKMTGRLPLQFRVLNRQFLLRVIDLEALSIQADVEGYLGQFAGILILITLFQAIGALLSPPPVTFAWHMEQSAISNMMLVVGLISVLTWDSTFPDRRDAMVLGPLPVKPRMILLAKIAASAALLGLAVVCLNFASSVAWSLIFAASHGLIAFLRFLTAYWFTIVAASIFLYGSVLTVQGFTALLLPRRAFLRISAFMQVAAFGLFLGVYFLEPSITTAAAMRVPENQWVLLSSPPYWFFALFNQLNGSLPANLVWLARRAWVGLGVALFGAAASLLLCYLRTMKKTVEEPDLVPAARGWHWTPRFGNALQTAILLFSFRSFTRSRQHRLILAFFLSVVFAIMLSMVRDAISAPAPRPVSMDLLVATATMISFAVFGFRLVFPLPISLNANWIVRVTQLRPSQEYIAATRRTLLVFAVFPTWLCCAALALTFRPLSQVAVHLIVLALFGSILADLCLIGFCKIPFTCSFLPGKTNIQYMFWGVAALYVVFAAEAARIEFSALDHPVQYVAMITVLGAAAVGLRTFNRHRAESAILCYEELPPEPITTLGLTLAPKSIVEPGKASIVS